MRARRRVAVVTIAVAVAVLGHAAPSQAGSVPGPMCFGRTATIVGTADPDVLAGGAEDVVVGLGGDDWLSGGTVCGGAGNDALSGVEGVSSRLDGGAGDDTVRGGPYPFGRFDVLLGGPGNDFLSDTDDADWEDVWDPGTDVMKGGPGDDHIVSTSGRNLLYGNAGDDVLVDYTHVRTVISGGAGDDWINSTGDNYGGNPYQPDRIAGDAGRDFAMVNRVDTVSSTETVSFVD